MTRRKASEGSDCLVENLGCVTEQLSLVVCALVQEPPKAAMLEYEASGRQGPKPARQAACIVQLPAEPGAAVAEALVDLSSPSPTIISWDRVGSPCYLHWALYIPCQCRLLHTCGMCLECEGADVTMCCAVHLQATCMCQELLTKSALTARSKACSPW